MQLFLSPGDRAPSAGECWFGGNAGQHGYLAGDSLLRAIFYSWLFSLETDENRQLWEQMEGFSVIRGWKNPLGKADRWDSPAVPLCHCKLICMARIPLICTYTELLRFPQRGAIKSTIPKVPFHSDLQIQLFYKLLTAT